MTCSPSRLALLLGFLLVASASGCGDEDEDSGTHNDGLIDSGTAGASDAGADVIDEDEEVPCTPDYPVFREGMTARAGDLTVKLVSISPQPPRQKMPNNWVLEVVGADGSPIVGVTAATPDSYMPVHRHHGRQPPKAAVGSAPGQVLLNAIDFKMRGPWQVNFDVVPPGGQPLAATIQVCVE